MYTPLPNDELTPYLSSCCQQQVYMTNGHERPDPPDTISTWWCVCSKCGEACSYKEE